jgi:hypothetical protein
MATVSTRRASPRTNQSYTIYSVPRPRTKRARKVTSFTDVKRAAFSTFAEAFVPAYDSRIASEQAMARVAPRVDQGQKMTPPGRGVNRRKRP